MNDNPVKGTELKYQVVIAAEGFSMDNDDWSVTITRGRISQTFDKADCIHGEGGWYVCFDTAVFGPGDYYATLTAYVPDSDFPDGLRTERKKIYLRYVEPE